MISGHVTGFLTPLVVLVIIVFLIYRLRFLADRNIDGRYAFLVGGFLVFGVAVWQLVRINAAYDSWFIPSVYPVIDALQFAVLVIGLLLMGAGLSLYSDYWQNRLADLKDREGKLAILDNLQKDARQPYQLLEFLNISLKEILFYQQGCAGAIFLINRKQRQFVLTSAVGLNKEETAYLEYYPLQGNIVSRAVDLGDPLISGDFDFINRRGEAVSSRFKSCLVLPLISGLEKVGGIILFAEESKYFSKADVKFLSPVADWLSEKIKTARLSRELTIAKNEIENVSNSQADFLARLFAASKALGAHDSLQAFCQALVGLSDGRDVHLIGLKNGSLVFFGGSEPLLDLSENYKTALLNALGRKKPLIINQETTDDSGVSQLSLSSLIYPLENGQTAEAILFRKETAPFKVSEHELKMLNIFAYLARMVLNKNSFDRLSVTRRLGLERIVEFLRLDEPATDYERDHGFFMCRLADILPENSIALTFVKDDMGTYKVLDSIGCASDEIREFSIIPGEGGLGRTGQGAAGQFIYGKKQVSQELDTYEAENKNLFNRLFGERGYPVCIAYCPLVQAETTLAVAAFFIYEMDESERSEWKRLLTLAGGLYSLRLTIDALQGQLIQTELSGHGINKFGLVVNQLNNYLSAIMGNAELAARQEDTPGEVRMQLKGIVAESEKAANLIKKTFARLPLKPDLTSFPVQKEASLSEVIDRVLKRFHISGNLYMTGGQPREVNLSLNDTGMLPFVRQDLEELFLRLIDRFATLAAAEDIISLAVYQMDEYVYLDISRHRKNFPPVERVARFGDYVNTAEAAGKNPANDFFRLLHDDVSLVAVDPAGPIPAYLSFKFPLKKQTVVNYMSDKPVERTIRVLAIDDEAVILDLIAAMCLSMGYQVKTATSGQEGVNLARKEPYDIILTDLAMPDMNGYEVARQLRQINPEIPIILVTGWEARIDTARLEPSGISEVLYKPFRIEHLTELIRKKALSR